jgi:hypothetical protein
MSKLKRLNRNTIAQAKEAETQLVDYHDATKSLNEAEIANIFSRHTLVMHDLRGWRATSPTLGRIEGVEGNLVCVATDGNLGVFERADGTALLGHVQNFIWANVKEITLKYKDEFGCDRFIQREIDRGAPPPKFGKPKADPPLKAEKTKTPALRKATASQQNAAELRKKLLAAL